MAYEEFHLEAYGPGGTGVLMEITSDNRNRTVAELRNLLTKHHGNMAEAGAVSWQFHKKGLLTVEKGTVDEDTLLSLALDAGAEDVKVGEKSFEVITDPHQFEAVKKPSSRQRSTPCLRRSPLFRRTRSGSKKRPPSKCSS